MATTHLHQSTPQRGACTANPVTDRRLSRRLDLLVLQIEANPPTVRRGWLRLQKLLAERHVPATGKGGVR